MGAGREISQVLGQRGRGRTKVRRREPVPPRIAVGRTSAARSLARNAAQRRPTGGLARAWCRSPAIPCPSSTRPASSPSTSGPREHAGLFDVSHMGPAVLLLARKTGDAEADHAALSAIIEPLISGDIRSLKPGQMRYTLLLNEEGGILDDLMIGRPKNAAWFGALYIVVNADTKNADFARYRRRRQRPRRAQPQRPLRAAGPARPRRRRCAARHHSGCRRPRLHDLQLVSVRGFALRHLTLRLHRRGRLRDPGAARSRRPLLGKAARRPPCEARSASAPATRSVSRPACRSTATTSMRRSRRSRRTSPSPCRSAAARPAISPAPARILREYAGDLSRIRVGLAVEGRAPPATAPKSSTPPAGRSAA